MFLVAAADFPQCADNSCLNECVSGAITCEEVMCGDDEADECADKTVEPPTYQEPITTEPILFDENSAEIATTSEASLP